MSILSSTAPRADLAGSHGIAGMVARLKDAIARRKVFVQTKRELDALSTRELADLGISRSMITRLAQEAAYGK
jgi:uncharacterized protein YjiS (DUF1127 family)